MPLYELIAYLQTQGDAIATRQAEGIGAELRTENGHRYVCSDNGRTFDGGYWRTKFLWCRV